MSLLMLYYKISNRYKSWKRKKLFKEQIKCKHNDFNIVGDITLINHNIELGHNVTIYPGCMFFGDGKIIVGNNVDIGNNTIIYASKFGGVSIGDNSVIAAQCYIIDADHGTCKGNLIRKQKNSVSPIYIGDDVWIAANCTILKGSEINNGAVIGAKSLVKGEIEPYSINVGIICKKIKERNNE